MSTEETLTEREEAVLGQTTQQSDESSQRPTGDTDALRAATTSHERPLHADVEDLREELEQERETKRELVRLVNSLQAKVDGDASISGQTTLEKYSSMTPEDRDELLSTSEWRAVEIHDHWDDLAWTTQTKNLMETQARANAKNQPSKIKYRLEKHFDTDLQANEIYRAMKAVARLSGGEASTDTNGRTHITGGTYEFHVLSTTDGSGTRRVLERVER